MARDNNRALARRARGKRSAESSHGASHSKRQKLNKDGQEESSAVLPCKVVSREDSSPRLAAVDLVTSGRKFEVSSGREAERVSLDSATAVLPTLPEADVLRKTYEHLNQSSETVSNQPDKKRHEASSRNETLGQRNHEGASGMTEVPKSPAALKCSRHSITSNHLHRSEQSFPILCGWLMSVCIIMFSCLTVYRSSLHQPRVLWSNYTEMPMLQVTLDDTMRRVPHKATATMSRHLLELDEYERQKSALLKTEKELERASTELADSRHDAVAARVEATNTQAAYTRVTSDLNQTKKDLVDKQCRLALALHEVSYTREELERTRWDLTMLAAETESLSEQLDEAYRDIHYLYHLLEVQETVAANVLNFVATTAVKQQKEAAAQALNFVTTLAMKQSDDCALSNRKTMSNIDE